MADYSAGDSMGIDYLLGNWATDHRVIAVSWRRGTPDLSIDCRIDCRTTTIARRSVAQGHGDLVGMALYKSHETSDNTHQTKPN